MGVITIAAYKPKPGKEEALRQVVKEHVPILRAEGLATDRVSHAMTCRDGTIVEVFEWESPHAIELAHRNANVMAMWGRFSEACDIVKLTDLAESQEMFAGFTPLDL